MPKIRTTYLSTFIVAFLIGFTFSMSGQSFEYVFPKGFGSQVLEVKKMTSGAWVLAVKYDFKPSGLFLETLSLIYLDPFGEFEKEVVVVPPYSMERLDFLWMDISTDDEVIIGFAGGDCDVVDLPLNLIKYNADGMELWAKWNMIIPTPDDYYWSKIYGILLAKYEWLYCLSPDDGEIRWQIKFGTDYPSLCTILSDTGDILFYENNKIHFATLDSIGGQLQYVIQQSRTMNFDWPFFQHLQSSSWNLLYSYSKTMKGVVRLNHNLDLKPFIPIAQEPQQILIDQSSIWVLANQVQNDEYLQSQLFQYDTSGALLNIYEPLPRNTWASQIIIEDHIGMAFGAYHSGTHFSNIDLLPHAARLQGWLKRAPLVEMSTPMDSFNVAITAARQEAEIKIDSTYFGSSFPWEYLYSFSGGDFSFEVTNLGTTPVHSLWLNTSFDFSQSFICSFGADAKQIFYPDIDLQPGASTWLHFGDIHADDQVYYPSEFCFWTSGPNITPDLIPEDDIYCNSFIVPVSEPTTSAFQLYPNPTTGRLLIEIGDGLIEKQWEVFNIAGQPQLSGILRGLAGPHTLDLNELIPGMYFLRLGNDMRKFVIDR